MPEDWRLGVHSYWVGTVVNLFFVLLAYVCSLAWPNRRREMVGLTVWTAHERAK